MKRVLTAAALIPVVLLIVFKAPLWLFALVVAAIIVLTLHEYLDIAERAGIKPFHWLTYILGVLPICVFWYSIWKAPDSIGPIYLFGPVDAQLLRACLASLALSPVVFGIPLVLRKDLGGGLAAASSSAFGIAYIAVSLSFIISLRASWLHSLVVFILASVWAGDIAAYYVGRTFGRHKLAPIVSPNKSWEGAIASVLASVAVSVLFFHFTGQVNELFSDTQWTRKFFVYPVPSPQPFTSVPWVHVFCLGVLTNVAAQLGDLFESALKRGAGVKDSSTLLPGHGGMLDRIDALLFAIPVVWYYANLTGFLEYKPIP
jgi:phosphatidate cytidylyltransferase